MAQYTVTHVCGHDETHQLYGPTKDRESKSQWLAGRDCSACYAAKRDAARVADNAAAAAANAAAGLPPLVGSDAQVAWAESIRRPVVAALDAVPAASNPALTPAAQGELADAVALVVSEVRGQTSAKWWIDGRDSDACRIASPAAAKHYVESQLRARLAALAPTAAAELPAIRAAAAAAAAARKARAAELARTIRVDDATVESDAHGNAETIRDGDVVVTGRGAGIGLLKVVESGVTLTDCASVGYSSDPASWCHAWGRAEAVANARRAAKAKAGLDAVLASLAGATVAAAERTRKRSEPNLIVTLSDGRVAKGYHVKSEGRLEIVEVAGRRVPADHADVARLAAAAGEVARG